MHICIELICCKQSKEVLQLKRVTVIISKFLFLLVKCPRGYRVRRNRCVRCPRGTVLRRHRCIPSEYHCLVVAAHSILFKVFIKRKQKPIIKFVAC